MYIVLLFAFLLVYTLCFSRRLFADTFSGIIIIVSSQYNNAYDTKRSIEEDDERAGEKENQHQLMLAFSY